MMALSIKNKETEALARDLARLTKKPITKAIHDVLAREVTREKSLQTLLPDVEIWRSVQAIQKRAAQNRLSHQENSDNWMYDEFGLPK